ncbi:g139 [Coccomyxa elongata]
MMTWQSRARKTKLREKYRELDAGSKAMYNEKNSHRNEEKGVYMEVLSWEPRAYLYHNFLTDAEADHLIQKGKPHMEKSEVVDNETGKSAPSKVRTSSGMFLNRGEDDIIEQIEARIAKYTAVPKENGEGLQVLNYKASEEYRPHFDYFHDQYNTQNGGQRIATMLMYLSDVEEGGETVFPDSPAKPNTGNSKFSSCAQAGVAVKPRKGDALFFYSLTPDGRMDETSLHAGCPVIRGDKWSATKWLRVEHFNA